LNKFGHSTIITKEITQKAHSCIAYIYVSTTKTTTMTASRYANGYNNDEMITMIQ